MNAEQSTSKQDLSFEDSMRELEQIVQKLENGNTPLNESISLYERGSELRSICSKRLKDAELRIEKIISVENGTPETEATSYE